MGFFNKYQRILMAAAFVGAVLVFGFLIYFLFFRSITPDTGRVGEEEIATSTGSAGFPRAETGTGQITGTEGENLYPSGEKKEYASPIAQGGLTEAAPLVDSPSLDVDLDSNGSSLRYYNKSDNKFYLIDKDGNLKALSDKPFYDVESVTWSPKDNKAILEYPDGANIIYDFDDASQITLPSHWTDYSFSPDGGQIVSKSLGLDPYNRWLIVANSDGSKARTIEELGENEAYVDVAWSPNNQVVATYREGASYDRQDIYLVGLNNENFKSLSVEGRGFQYLWSPKGDLMLYSVYSSQTNYNPSLWSVYASGNDIGANRKNLNISTWAEKCVFADNYTVYCAVPENLEEGSGLFPELALDTKDDIYKIDLEKGTRKLVAIPDGDYTITNVIIAENGRYLYFTDNNGKIYKINLQ